MTPKLLFEPLLPSHLDELATVLLHPAVYEHIEERLPTLTEFKLGLQRAIAGPGESAADERWLNFLVREPTGAMLGRLEATVHHGLVEVAFVFGSQHWDRGFATRALRWLHEEVERLYGITDFWATAISKNHRSLALLRRCGYAEAQPPSVPLYSFAPGDMIFHRRSPT